MLMAMTISIIDAGDILQNRVTLHHRQRPMQFWGHPLLLGAGSWEGLEVSWESLEAGWGDREKQIRERSQYVMVQ